MKTVFSYVQAHKIIVAIVVISVLIEGLAVARGAGQVGVPSYTLVAARVGTISQTVSGTGQIQGQNQISVTPQGSGGQVLAVNVKPGDMVVAGQVLVTLDGRAAALSLQQAKAGLESAQANYDKVVGGLTPEQTASYQSSLTNATQSLTATLISSYTSVNNLIRTSIDGMFTSPTTDPSFNLNFLDSSGNLVTFTSNDQSLLAKINGERSQLNTLLPSWQKDASSLSLVASTTNLSSHVTLALNNLQYVAGFLNDLSNAVYNIYAQYTKYSSNINSYKSTVASALQSVDSQISSLTSSSQSLASAQASYNLSTAAPTDADVKSAQASLDGAEVSYQTAQTNYQNTRVTAPFTGQIGSVAVQVGDVASASTAIATLVTAQKIADISLNEVDAAAVHVGDPVQLTFSALPNATVPATVSQMSLVGTVSSGVVNYDVKITLATSTQNFRQNAQQNLEQILAEIKPGMSVTAAIITESHANAVTVPSGAVKSVAGGRGFYVQELPGATAAGQLTTSLVPKNVPVTVGITNGTQTEILSGVALGDLVITQTSAKGATTATTAAAATTRAGGFGGLGGGGFGGGAGGAARAGGGAAVIRAF